VVEDAVNGVQAAKAAGMRCVAVAQTFPAAQLESADLVRQHIAAVSLADLTGATANPTPDEPPPVISSLPPGPPTSTLGVAPGPWGLWATLGFTAALVSAFVLVETFVVLIWVIVGTVSGHHVVPRDLEANGLLLALATCAATPVVIPLTYLFARIRRGMRVADYLALRPVPLKQLLRWTAVFLVLLVLSDCLTACLGRPIVPDFMVRVYRTAGFVPLLALAIILVAPLMEEVVFRGFLFEGLAHSCLGRFGAITLTSLLWSLTHVQYDAYGIATIFISGLLLGFIRLRTGSLYVTILLHGLMNLVATLEVMVMSGGSRPGG
jgi:membrane protease YdiL (CAAX protease family)